MDSLISSIQRKECFERVYYVWATPCVLYWLSYFSGYSGTLHPIFFSLLIMAAFSVLPASLDFFRESFFYSRRNSYQRASILFVVLQVLIFILIALSTKTWESNPTWSAIVLIFNIAMSLLTAALLVYAKHIYTSRIQSKEPFYEDNPIEALNYDHLDLLFYAEQSPNKGVLYFRADVPNNLLKINEPHNLSITHDLLGVKRPIVGLHKNINKVFSFYPAYHHKAKQDLDLSTMVLLTDEQTIRLFSGIDGQPIEAPRDLTIEVFFYEYRKPMRFQYKWFYEDHFLGNPTQQQISTQYYNGLSCKLKATAKLLPAYQSMLT